MESEDEKLEEEEVEVEGEVKEDEESLETQKKLKQMFLKQLSVTSEGSTSSKQSAQKSRTKWLVAAVSIAQRLAFWIAVSLCVALLQLLFANSTSQS